jgi:putative pyruvate formate lyase activating enzyme
MPTLEPAYLQTHRSGLLRRKTEQAVERLCACTQCPRRCGVNRLAGETGVCKTGRLASVSSFNAHFGEEAPLVGEHGSGTVFFTHCNLLCLFCQNFDISHQGAGQEVTEATESPASASVCMSSAQCPASMPAICCTTATRVRAVPRPTRWRRRTGIPAS